MSPWLTGAQAYLYGFFCAESRLLWLVGEFLSADWSAAKFVSTSESAAEAV